VYKNNVRRRGKLPNNFSEIVRIASIVQKGMDSGRSNYVEMRALARLTGQNIRAKIHKIQAGLKKEDSLYVLLGGLTTDLSKGYTDVLTPNGIVRDDKLDALLSLDSDIVICLDMIIANEGTEETESALRELVEERKNFVACLRA
jgi:hypothetical protein